MTTRVVLIEDHTMVREALCDLLARHPGIEVVGQAGSAAEGLARVTELNPDVVVLDIRLPDLNGIEVAARLRDAQLSARIVALSAFTEKLFVTAMVRAGAVAFVTKSSAGIELIGAIQAVVRGENYFSREVARVLASEVRIGAREADSTRLSRRELEVLRLIAEGRHSPGIGRELHVSQGTVEVHRRNIMRKLRLHTIADLTKYAIREGIVSL
jgi:DNA-binding NarL/FixJ family response regulator